MADTGRHQGHRPIDSAERPHAAGNRGRFVDDHHKLIVEASVDARHPLVLGAKHHIAGTQVGLIEVLKVAQAPWDRVTAVNDA